ncbi:MAG: hypothetical protein HWN65_05570 [Candidatus Helarchaeota archaeon]|nr:hypothetical protein [Candidatus Helarchaeota archaeon]
MNGSMKGPAIGAGFLGIGFIILYSHLLIEEISYLYVTYTFAFFFILGGLTVFVRLTALTYRVAESRGGFRTLNEEVHFYALEFTKVTAVTFFAFYYPWEAFLMWVILDCMDGFTLSYGKRSLPLRHKIDKFTDFLCQIPLFIVALQLWADLPVLSIFFTAFFILLAIKTALFVITGNRDALLYLPGAFAILYLVVTTLYTFFPSQFSVIFGNVHNTIACIAVVLVICTAYEVIYNGVLIRLRYRVQKGGRE